MPAATRSAGGNPTLFQEPELTTGHAASATSAATSPTIIKAEANMLRFPFFALGRRGLSNRKGLDIRGHTTIDGHATDFQYRITCNSDDPYPGPLARKCHFALLDILQSTQTFPFSNPIEFTWRELMSHCGMSIGGMGERQLKQAIRSIEGTRVRTTFALKNANDSYLKTREQGYGLYARYVFVDEHLPDATMLANRNFVWLSDWYLNKNSPGPERFMRLGRRGLGIGMSQH